MISIDQTIIDHNPEKGIFGNCLQACVASLFELPLESVPHFACYPKEEWQLIFIDFIYEQGYVYEGWAPIEELNNPDCNVSVDGYKIMSGISPREYRHAVIYKDNALVHDPHPSKLGLKEVLGFHMIRKADKVLSNPWRLFL